MTSFQEALYSLSAIEEIVKDRDNLTVLKVALEDGYPSSRIVQFAREDLWELIASAEAVLDATAGFAPMEPAP